MFFRVLRGFLGHGEFAVVSGQVSARRWRKLVQAVEHAFAEDVVALLEGFAFCGREVFVCEFEAVAPASVWLMLILRC